MFKNNEIKESKEDLLGREKRLVSILETTQDGFFIFDKNKKIIDVNNAYCEMSGYTREEILNLSILDIDLYDSSERIKKVEENLLSKGHHLFETKHLKKNGEIFDIEVSISLLDEEPAVALCFCRDITEKKKDERKIIKIKERLKNIIEATNAGTCEWNIQTGETNFDKKWAEMLGYKKNEIPIRNNEIWEKLTHPDDKKIAEKEFNKVLNKEIEHYNVELRKKHKNGKWIWINERGKVTKWSDDGKPIIISGIHIDITEKKENEQKIIEMKERYENIIKGTDAGTWEWNIKKDNTIVNKKYAKMLGYKLEEICPMNIKKWIKLVHPDDLIKYRENMGKIWNKETEYYNIEIRVRKKNGKWIWVNSRGKVIKWSDDGTPIIMSGTHTDITEKKKKEQEILEIKEKLENIIEGNNVGTWEWEIKTGKLDVNDKWAEMLGYKLEEISPVNLNTWKRLTHPDDLDNAQIKLNKALNKDIEFYDAEIRMKHKNGNWIWINDRGKVTKWSKNGKAILMSGTHTDISEKKQEQEQIEYLSFHDPLTGLYNRRYMKDSINRLDTDRNIPFSIILADINGLKLTNDTYGHEMGDKLLISAAEILKKSCRKEDIICRIGGDEFIILLPNTDEKTTKEILARIKEKSKNTKLDSVIISIAVGYSTKTKKDQDISQIYKEADNSMYKDKIKIGRIMRSKTIETLLVNINNKYDNEQIHTERTSQYCESIARNMKLNKKEIQDTKTAGVLHDIGKIVIDPELLNKKDNLTDKEWEEIKKHPTISYQILKNVDEYSHLAEAVLYHHERIDGKGYPEGLKEDKIPLISKIISVADAYEAMTANRPYKNIKTKEEAVKELKKKAGTQFDKEIVEIFVNEVL